MSSFQILTVDLDKFYFVITTVLLLAIILSYRVIHKVINLLGFFLLRVIFPIYKFFFNILHSDDERCRGQYNVSYVDFDAAWKYYVATVYPTHENVILATSCYSLRVMRNDQCGGKRSPMGYAAPRDLEGIYHFHKSCERAGTLNLNSQLKCV